MDYPGRVIKAGERDATIVPALKTALNTALAAEHDAALRLDPNDPAFDERTRQAVMFFQARHVDARGRPLNQDGEVGPLTWAVIFGEGSLPAAAAAGDALLGTVLEIAGAQEARHVREVPKNSNRGPEVDEYLRRAGVDPGLSWCCAFVYWCFDEAARRLDRTNPMVKTAGCLDHWNRAASKGATRIPAARALDDPGLVRPGMIFVMDHGGGLGHTGLVETMAGGLLTTIEGNTDASKTREGGGVYRLTRRLGEINAGFIDYAGV
jgi:CHAP domain-containing protein